MGLAPLDLGSSSNLQSNENKPKNSDTDFVHLPAKNLTKVKQVEKIRERITTAKEKRELLDKIREIKSLGSGEETSASTWVEKMRLKEKAKFEAEKRVCFLFPAKFLLGESVG